MPSAVIDHELELDLADSFSSDVVELQGRPVFTDRMREEIVNKFWPSNDATAPKGSDSVFDAYFRFFRKTCLQATDLKINLYREIIQLVVHLQKNQDTPRKDLLSFFPPTPLSSDKTLPETEERKGYRSIDFCIHLWLMVDMGTTRTAERRLVMNYTWQPEQSIRQVMMILFPRQPVLMSHKARWPPIFQAQNLQRLGGFKIFWEEDLRKHLSFDEESSCLYIFHHMSVVKRMISSSARTPFPDGLFDETLDSVALLIRRHKPEGRKWFNSRVADVINEWGYKNYVDVAVGEQPLRANILSRRRYQFWGEDLEYIKNAFDTKEPETLWQWWIDQRNRTDHWSFWLTASGIMLAILFGLLSTIIGGWQVYLVYYPPV